MIKPQEREREKKNTTLFKGIAGSTLCKLVTIFNFWRDGREIVEIKKKPNKSAEALFQDKHAVMLKLYHAYLKIHPLRSELSSTSPSPPPKKINEFFFTKAYLIIISGSYLHFQLVTFRYHIIYTPARSWDFFVLKLFHSCRRGHGVWDNNVVNIKRIATFLLL